MPHLGANAIHVIGGLGEALREGYLQGFVQDFQLNDHPLHGAMETLGWIWEPLDQKTCAAALQAVLLIDAPTAVDDPLEKCLHQQPASRPPCNGGAR